MDADRQRAGSHHTSVLRISGNGIFYFSLGLSIDLKVSMTGVHNTLNTFVLSCDLGAGKTVWPEK